MRRRSSSRPQAYRTRSPRVYWLRRGVLAAVVLLLVTTSWSIMGALRAPGDDGVSVKLAEWARDHSLGPVVTLAENIQYKLNPPPTGGAPDTTQLAAAAAETSKTAGSNGAVLKRQAPIVPPVSPALAGEGVYVPVVKSAAGVPLVQETFVRPDAVHTSFLTGVAWMSHTLRFVLHPGFQDPGLAGMTQPDTVVAKQAGLVATFNGGFKLKDAQGGYFDNGKTVGTLTAGAASLVIYKDGHATVGTWGQDVSMTPSVAFVRQNLKPLVSGGQVAANLDSNVQSTWGATIGGSAAVWRSGIGVTANGDLVYVMGDAMSVSDLADVLQRAGAVTGMQLDINQAWVSYMYYSHTGTNAVPHKLGKFQRPVDRYFSHASRDFFAVYAP